MDNKTFINQYGKDFFALLESEFKRKLAITSLCRSKAVADDTIKLLLSCRNGEKMAALMISPEGFSNSISDNMAVTKAVKNRLSEPESSVVLDPLLEGRLASGLSYSVLPYMAPLSSNRIVFAFEKRILAPKICDWLLACTAETKTKVKEDDFNSFAEPLNAVKNSSLPTNIKNAAALSLNRLAQGEWEPYLCLEHGDFWHGNILRKKGGNYPFTVIDWPGANLQGYAVKDFVCLSMSLRLSDRLHLKVIKRYSVILNCKAIDLMGYLIASLGWLQLNLGELSEQRYNELAVAHFDKLSNIIRNI